MTALLLAPIFAPIAAAIVNLVAWMAPLDRGDHRGIGGHGAGLRGRARRCGSGPARCARWADCCAPTRSR